MTVFDPEVDKEIAARLKELPKVLRDAIESSDVEKRLRELATIHKLHVDQWQILENEVMLTLLGFEQPEDLAQNVKENVKVSEEIASSLATDISRIIFEPIRQELERELEHPEAKEKEVSEVEQARQQALEQVSGVSKEPAVSFQLSGNTGPIPAAVPQNTGDGAVLPPDSRQLKAESSPVVPATTPPPPPTEKAIRMPASGAYVPGEASSLRRDIEDDPYRESPQ
ncbi:hypothetical protein A3C21_00320 [Candidatus Kaiserbacteria bacterium RIFCSPHIGHO2_02_FULL_59_21]|uniref:Uncharacterized protein n=1 Tax=Candidatus Kaiserbacteria bacterium RIFCSPHIGHO2_02_FULL_59_21 TaxID=1798500 RepID=A0A1F6E1N9_9BACT|nr:MAG: hypothetical protein A3C21_00320 [Candidatus Kaiserbacteria bacterium RIFCSPHIGHO2_02_FULL_59_21]OGG86316.1 MAG: hypothetical protein A3I47_04060 [Candidatus Kaiserbacteria bacterium RIFCSPLOWO2_02_FULL_59_19]